jgi:hypothetical protein
MRAENHGQLTETNREELAVDRYAWQSAYQFAARTQGDVRLTAIKSELTSDAWYNLAAGKGTLALHALRGCLGDDLFEKTMDAFGREHAGQKVTTAQFLAHIRKTGKKFDPFLRALNSSPLPANAATFSIRSFEVEQESTLIVYGTTDEAPTNREAAESLQKAVRESWQNRTIPIKSDKEVTDADLKNQHILLIGRPDSNRLVERFRKQLPITFGSRSFVVAGKTYANAGSAIIAAADNPLNLRYSMVLVAGLSAEATLHAPERSYGTRDLRPAQVLLLPQGERSRALVLDRSQRVAELK